MAEIRPFRAVQFRTPPIPIEKVVTQPYDKITPRMRERYLAAHPNNLVRILRPLDDPETVPERSPYQSAAETSLEVQDEYGVAHRIWALTSPELIRSVREHLASERLVIADGHHRYETALAFRDEERGRTGRGDAGGFEWLMTTLVNLDSPGMLVLPTHRLLSQLARFDPSAFLARVGRFAAVTAIADGELLLRELPESGRRRQSFGLALPGGKYYLLTLREDVDPHGLLPDLSPRQASLDVVLLHRLLLGQGLGLSEEAVRGERHIRYVRDSREALDAVTEGSSQMACLLNPTPLEAVRAIALEGGLLPQKSTDFFPKLLSGLVMYCGDN